MPEKFAFLTSVLLSLGLDENCILQSVEALDSSELEDVCRNKEIPFAEVVLSNYRGKNIFLFENVLPDEINIKRIFEEETALFSLLLLRKVRLYTVHTGSIKTREEYSTFIEITGSYKPFIVRYILKCNGKSVSLVQVISQNILKESLKEFNDVVRYLKIPEDFLNVFGIGSFEKFDDLLGTLLWFCFPAQKEIPEELKKNHDIVKRLKELSRELTVKYFNMVKNMPVNLLNSEYLLISKMFFPDICRKIIGAVYNKDIILQPLELGVLNNETLLKENSGFVLNVSHDFGSSMIVLHPKDTRKLLKRTELSLEQLIEKFLAASFWFLPEEKRKFRVNKAVFTDFNSFEYENKERWLKLNYKLTIGNWEPIYFRQLIPISFPAALFPETFSDIVPGVAWIISQLIISNDKFRKTAGFSIELPEPRETNRDPLKKERISTGEFIYLHKKGLRLFIQEFIKKNGIHKLALAFRNTTDELKIKICGNMSKNASRQFLTALKTNRESPVEISMAKRDSFNILFSLYAEKKIKLPVHLKRFYAAQKNLEDKRTVIETELILKSRLFEHTISELTDVQLQLLLTKTTHTTLVRSLYKTDDETKKRIFKNMSENMQKIVIQDYNAWLQENSNILLKTIKAGEARRIIMENSINITGNVSAKTILDYYLSINRYYASGDYNKVIEICEKALSFQQKARFELNSMFYGLPAWIYAFQEKNLDRSHKLALKALSLAKTDAEKCFHLDTIGWIYYKKGNAEEALIKLREAQKLNKEGKYVKEHLDLIRSNLLF